MFAYAKFLSKRVYCRKSNIALMIVPIFIILFFLIMNIRSQGQFRSRLEKQIQTDMETVETYTDKLAQYPSDSEAYMLCELTIEQAQSNSKTYQKLISYVDDENWTKLYESYGKVLNQKLQMEKDASEIMGEHKDESSSVYSQIAYIQYLHEHNLVYEEADIPIFGLSFTTYLMQFILPILITIFCAYTLAQVFTFDYSKGMDISVLLPIQRGKALLTKLFVGMFASLLVYVVILGSSFLLATLLSGDSGWEYPMILRSALSETWDAMSGLVFMKDWFFLGILFYVSLALFSYLVSIFIREDVYLFFIVVSIVLGMVYMPTVIGSMKLIAHVLPTTYMNSVNVAYGNISTQYANPNIHVSTGYLVLTITIVVQFLLCVLYNQRTKLHLLRK